MRIIAAVIIATLFVGCGRRPVAEPVDDALAKAPEPHGDGGGDERHSASADAAAKTRRALILAEVKDLDADDWAGDYYAGDGLGANLSLCLAPRAGFVFEWHGCLGLYDRNYGAVVSKDGRIRLQFTFKNTREGYQGIAAELVPVRWEARRYLVPADDVIGFCNYVNHGSEPRTIAHGFYLLRRGDETRKVAGWPELPPEYRDYLLSKPVEATVLAVGPSTTRPSIAGGNYKDTQLTLDAGKQQGLKAGMTLVVTQPDDRFESVRIREVEDHRAEAIMTQFGEEAPSPKVGWRLSTSSRWKAQEPK
jgi:hypothetical protein